MSKNHDFNVEVMKRLGVIYPSEHDSGGYSPNSMRDITTESLPKPYDPPSAGIELEIYDKSFNLYGNWTIAADFHVPFQNDEMIKKMIEQSETMDVDRLFIGGDLLTGDSFAPFSKLTPPVDWNKERGAARKLILNLLEQFVEIRIILGNHEKWFNKQLQGGDWTDLWNSVIAPIANEVEGKVHFSKYGYALINDVWLCSHGPYLRNQLSAARTLCNNHKDKVNVIVFHGHTTGFGFAPNGRHVLIDCGLMADEKKFEYKNTQLTTHPSWSQSFLILKDNRISIYTERDEFLRLGPV